MKVSTTTCSPGRATAAAASPSALGATPVPPLGSCGSDAGAPGAAPAPAGGEGPRLVRGGSVGQPAGRRCLGGCGRGRRRARRRRRGASTERGAGTGGQPVAGRRPPRPGVSVPESSVDPASGSGSMDDAAKAPFVAASPAGAGCSTGCSYHHHARPRQGAARRRARRRARAARGAARRAREGGAVEQRLDLLVIGEKDVVGRSSRSARRTCAGVPSKTGAPSAAKSSRSSASMSL